MKNKTQTQYSAVNMEDFGIDAVVLTPHTNIENLFDNFEREPDFAWVNGRGKEHLYENLKKSLRLEDSFFTKNPSAADTDPIRWENFMDDCVILAVLHCVLKNQSLKLLHPSCFTKPDREKPWFDKTGGVIPDLIDSIPCEH